MLKLLLLITESVKLVPLVAISAGVVPVGVTSTLKKELWPLVGTVQP